MTAEGGRKGRAEGAVRGAEQFGKGYKRKYMVMWPGWQGGSLGGRLHEEDRGSDRSLGVGRGG